MSRSDDEKRTGKAAYHVSGEFIGSRGTRDDVLPWCEDRGISGYQYTPQNLGNGFAPLAPTAQASTPGNSSSQARKNVSPNSSRQKVAKKAAKKVEKKTRCCNEGLIFEYTHEGKSHTHSSSSLLQITAGAKDNPAQIIARTKITSGPCEKHKGKVFENKDHATIKDIADNKILFEVTCPERFEHYKIFMHNFKNIWPKQHYKQKIYAITTSTCDADDEITRRVEVFPDTKWEIKGEVGFEIEIEKENSNKLLSLNKGSLDFHALLDIKLHADGKIKGWKKKIELKKSTSIIGILAKTANYMITNLCRIGGDEISLLGPTISCEGTWGYEEIDGGKVDYANDITISFDPLFGISDKWDILDRIPQWAWYPVGKAISFVKKRIADKIIKTGITVEASGQIGGKITLKKYAGEEKHDISGKVDGSIGLEIKAEAVTSKYIEWFHVHFGAKGGIKSSFYGDIGMEIDKDGYYWTGTIGWNGLEAFHAAYFTSDAKIKPYVKKSKMLSHIPTTLIKKREWSLDKIYLFS